MPWMQGYPYYLIMGSVLSLYMGVSSCRYRNTPGRRYLWILLLLVSVIFGATAGEILSESFQAKLWWRNIQQAPLFLSTIFTYAVVKEYISRSSDGLNRRLALFCIPVALYVLLIFTDSWHHLMRTWVGMNTVAGVSGIVVHPTVLNMALIAYDQLFGVYAVFLLAVSLQSASKYHFKWNVLMLLSLLIPIGSIFLLPLLKITMTGFIAFTYLPPVIVGYFSMFRDPELSLYPKAKKQIIENMKDGIVLTDRFNNIIDINEAGEQMLSALAERPEKSWLGKNIFLLLERYGEVAVHYYQRLESQFEIDVPGTDGSCYGLSLIATEPGSGMSAGMLIVFSDLSEKKRYERELLYQATVDDLTGLYNRRHFVRLIENYTSQNEAGIALLLFDIDDFKLINDTYGHMAGDQALIDFSDKILRMYQNRGIAGRIGGEEFAVGFLADNEEAALAEAEEFCSEMSRHLVRLDGGRRISLTVSAGIAFTKDSGATFETLYRQADEALYLSKTGGKNKVTLGRQPALREARSL
ncbi:histidine kinase N-terminal 7TM domain-containing diguanylate cyclase [Paenibacillus typhae]|uniref:histidine kinase N-terminal 7TM domain-containing diguanylate cyclase n=1 Tax=Paenibacillus typhae TaxID=1174501 RepID=UPI001C8EF8CF|nr:diguanylate cyclase [Paenibacillus typhae]MBY0009239.1 diguanylate cyclase [Paenibacillus typhae]